uniref:ABM domain-containing protein n=1 Tax=Tetraselmis chuii TaxID=63592 RepID=A0A7S1T144_9CHLO|mmetsp:Transcript_39952/g.71715  ORF Transcript_39952/g.71715 Transcript_39952/m.71715 type:complete len:297 (+) Transcript_39952:2-892(+)
MEIGRDRTVDYLGHADNEAALVLENAVGADSEAVISVILGHYVEWDCFAEFEAALNNLGRAAQDFDSDGFVGATLVRPQQGSNLFTVILRFRGQDSLQAWMLSETRRLMSARLHKYTQSEVEVRVGSHTAVDLLLTGHDQASTTAAPKPPPAKWKVCCIVCVSLYICSLPAAFWLTPAMGRAGVPTLWAVLVTSTINTYLHGYTLTPLFSLWLKPWLDADRPAFLTRHPALNASFPVRWLYEGFNPTELAAVMALMFGLLIGFAVSADIFDSYGPGNGIPSENATLVGCGMVFPYP